MKLFWERPREHHLDFLVYEDALALRFGEDGVLHPPEPCGCRGNSKEKYFGLVGATHRDEVRLFSVALDHFDFPVAELYVYTPEKLGMVNNIQGAVDECREYSTPL